MIVQYGALPFRIDEEKGLQILLITSRDTGRWVIPKGNPMPRLRGHETAAQEAFEEAGIEGRLSDSPIGRFTYGKRRRSGEVVPAEVTVYALRVERHHSAWPEQPERTVRWFDSPAAAMAVEEPELKAMIEGFDPAAHGFSVLQHSRRLSIPPR